MKNLLVILHFLLLQQSGKLTFLTFSFKTLFHFSVVIEMQPKFLLDDCLNKNSLIKCLKRTPFDTLQKTGNNPTLRTYM